VAALVTSFQSPARTRYRGGLVAIVWRFLEAMVGLDPTLHARLIADRAERRS
jgi:hypothetical protein